MKRKPKFKAQAREGHRPGDVCEHCGEPKAHVFTILNFGLNMDVGMCRNDACPGEAKKSPEQSDEA